MSVSKPSYAHVVIAVDGTAGAGKSTTSRGVAKRLGLRYLDTGAMYRAVTWAMLNSGTSTDDAEGIAARAGELRVESGTDPEAPSIAVDGMDVSREIRSDPVTAAVSRVSAVPRVRQLMVALQQREMSDGGIVVEGRDIGTVVAPGADVKVFLTADPAARARRRAAELVERDQQVTAATEVDQVEADLERRDSADSSRPVSPMAVAKDAVTIDTTYLTLDDVIDQIVQLAHQRLAVAHGG